MADNLNAPLEILQRLTKDRNGGVRRKPANNPSMLPSLIQILSSISHASVLQRVAENPNTPPKILQGLAKNRNKYVRLAVARNSNTPIDTLRHLAEDKNRDARLAVRAIPLHQRKLFAAWRTMSHGWRAVRWRVTPARPHPIA